MRKHSTVTLLRGIPKTRAITSCVFGGMLRGGMRGHAAGFIQPGDGALRFQIEVLLPADAAARLRNAAGWTRSPTASPRAMRSGAGVKTSREDRIFDGEDRGQRLVFHRHAAPRRAALHPAFRRAPRRRAGCDTCTSVGKSGSSCRLEPESPSPGTSCAVRTVATPGSDRRRGNIQRLHQRMSVRRQSPARRAAGAENAAADRRCRELRR